MKVLISGAGVAGPTLAFFLAKAGAEVTILEKTGTFLKQGHNIDLDRNAVSVVTKMGLLEELRRFNTTEKGTQFVDSEGKTYAQFPVKPGTPSPTSEFEILRGDLAAVLYSATKENPSVTYIFGTTVEKVVENNDELVRVELSNGETKEFDLLVAADGQWSKIRSQVFPPDSITDVDKNLFVVYATIPRSPSDNDWWNIYTALKSRTISTRPDPYSTIRAVLTLFPLTEEQKRVWTDATRSLVDREEKMRLVRREFADAGWEISRILDGIEESEEFYFQSVQQIRMKKWHSSRVVCIGDAAHAPTPLTGMGTTLAILGSYILAGELAATLKDSAERKPTIEAALEAYDAKFHPYVEKIQNLPSFVPGIVHPSTVFGRTLLKTFVGTAAAIMGNSWVSKLVFDSSEKVEDEPKSKEGGFKLPEYPLFA